MCGECFHVENSLMVEVSHSLNSAPSCMM